MEGFATTIKLLLSLIYYFSKKWGLDFHIVTGRKKTCHARMLHNNFYVKKSVISMLNAK